MEIVLILSSGKHSGKEFPLKSDISIVGSLKTACDLVLDHATVSPKHCQISKMGTFAEVRDLNSKEGTILNGARVNNSRLQQGDLLKIGRYSFSVQMGSGAKEGITGRLRPATPTPSPMSAADKEEPTEVVNITAVEAEREKEANAEKEKKREVSSVKTLSPESEPEEDETGGSSADKRSVENLNKLVLSVATTMASAMEYRSRPAHSEKSARLAALLAKCLGLPEEEVRLLRLAALLMNIGMLGETETIVSVDRKLTGEERVIVQKHAHIGAKLTRAVMNDRRLEQAIEQHHERYDGAGYPHRLSGEKISHLARILAVADAFSAMTDTRPFRPPLSLEEAALEIKQNSGSQFDPKVVEAFDYLFREKKLELRTKYTAFIKKVLGRY